jgi:hypothetical protein
MKTIYFTTLAGLLLAGCSDKNANSTSPVKATNAPGNSVLSAPADYVGGLANAQNKALKTVDVASVNEAIQMFNEQEGRFPKDLNELVTSKMIPKIPAAPYGMKLSYDSTAGKVSVVPQ